MDVVAAQRGARNRLRLREHTLRDRIGERHPQRALGVNHLRLNFGIECHGDGRALIGS